MTTGRPRTRAGTAGQMWTVRLADGSWVARQKLRTTAGRIVQRQRTARTKTAAIEALRSAVEQELRHSLSGAAITGETTLAALAEFWLEEREVTVAPQTLAFYRKTVERVIKPAIGDLRINELSTGLADAFLKALAKEAPSKPRRAKVVLGQMMKLAVRHGATDVNPLLNVGPVARPKPQPFAFGAGEAQAIIDGVEAWQRSRDPFFAKRPAQWRDDYYADLLRVLLGSGLRIGEALGLRVCDVDVTATPVTIRVAGKVLEFEGASPRWEPAPKTVHGYRTLSVPDFAAQALRKRLSLVRERGADALLFATRDGRPLSSRNFRTALKKAARHGGFAHLEPSKTHRFRKTVATILANGKSLALAGAALGHAPGSAVTALHYVVQSTTVDPVMAAIIEAELTVDAAAAEALAEAD